MLVYAHPYPTEKDAPELLFYFLMWFLLVAMFNWTLSYVVGIVGFHLVWDGLIALFVAYLTVYLNKLGTP